MQSLAMLTLFTTAKSFTGEARTRQLNALESWKRIHPDVEILLFGEGEGYGEVAADLGLVHVPHVQTSNRGCPRIDSMFMLTEKMARYPVRAYLNCDIILANDLLAAVRRVPFERFLMVAQRRSLAVGECLTFNSGWEEDLRNTLANRGRIDDPSGIDMFLYCGDIWRGLPELVVGRAGYDNFLIFFCRRNGVPVVDATEVATLIHQLHDYGHVQGGQTEVFMGDDARTNLEKSGGISHLFTIVHSDWRLTRARLVPNRCRGNWIMWAEANRILQRSTNIWKSPLNAVMADLCYEFHLRCRADYPNRTRAMLKFPSWAVSRVMGWR